MWADADAQVDYLNFSEVTELAAELVALSVCFPCPSEFLALRARESPPSSIS